MLTQQDIDKTINADFEKFYASLYDGEPVPSDILERFKIALMVLPPSNHQIHFDKIQLLISKKNTELTHLEVGMIINLIYRVAPERFYSGFEDFMYEQERLTKIEQHYNLVTDTFQKAMERKKQSLMKIANNTGGLRIITNGQA